jgi:hypothetical protein
LPVFFLHVRLAASSGRGNRALIIVFIYIEYTSLFVAARLGFLMHFRPKNPFLEDPEAN